MNSTNQKIDFKISGMTCSGCANTVEQAISELEGVHEVSVDLANNSATVEYESDKLAPADFKKAIEGAGYSFEGVE